MIALLFRHWKLIGIGLACVALLASLWGAYSAVWQRGYDSAQRKNDALQRASEAQAARDTAALYRAINAIDETITIDTQAIGYVRTVYRDKIKAIAVDVFRDRDCVLPDRLLEQINAASQAYGAAASGSSDAAVPTAGTPH